MAETLLPSDSVLVDLLRKRGSMTVTDLADALDVTATAVRQRLTRLLDQGYVDRSTSKAGRGRPSHHYSLSEKGLQATGSNFSDLAMALWDEIRDIPNPEIRRGLLQRISRRLADRYSDDIHGDTLADRMTATADVFRERKIPFEVDETGDLPVLNALACPYPALAEQDRSICAMERSLISEMLGETVKLSKCRLDGDACCTFEPS